MKKILSLILLLIIPSLNAYEIRQPMNTNYSRTIKTHLIINREKRRLELEFRNKYLDTHINIKKTAIRWAIQTKDAPVVRITLSPETQASGNTTLQIENIQSESGEIDSFRSIETMLREYQKDLSLKKFYESFIASYDIPSEYTIPDLPFHPQAPLLSKENWEIHEESCEEAGILLNHYITNGIVFSPEKMNADIIAMNEFQKNQWIPEDKYSKRYNKYFLRDLTNPEEMYDLLGKKYLWYTDETILMVKNPSITNIEQFVRSNHVLTIPMKYTSELRNKYIRAEKTFHIMNIVWYTDTQFITLDPGTKNGRYLAYPKNQLFESLQNNGNYFIALKKK